MNQATLEECWTVALSVYTPRGAILWMNTRNPEFNDRTPVDAVQDGEGAAVLAALNAAADGVFA